MVYQLSLVSSIPNTQYELTLQTLRLLTGMDPHSLNLHHVVLRPKFPFNPELQLGKINQIEQYRIKLISNFNDTKGEKKFYRMKVKEDLPHLVNKDKLWTLQMTDIPIAGKKPTCQQNVYETIIEDSGAHDDLLGYLDELGYKLNDEYWLKGEKFHYNNIIIEVFRIWVSETELLDKSGTWFVKCYINIKKSTDLELINKSQKELASLSKEVNGLFELVIPDRLSMDSRINSIK